MGNEKNHIPPEVCPSATLYTYIVQIKPGSEYTELQRSVTYEPLASGEGRRAQPSTLRLSDEKLKFNGE